MERLADMDCADLGSGMTLDQAAAHGRELLRVGRLAEAARVLEIVVAHGVGGGEVEFQLALALARLGCWDQAEGRFATVARAYPTSPVVAVNIGYCRLNQARLGGAAAAYRMALVLEPSMNEAHIGLAGSFERSYDGARAVVSWARAARLVPGRRETLLSYAAGLRQSGRSAEAVLVLEPVLEGSLEGNLDGDLEGDDDPLAFTEYAICVMSLPELESAGDALDRARRNAHFAGSLVARLIDATLRRDWTTAHALFDEWRARFPYHAPIYQTFYMKRLLASHHDPASRRNPGRPRSGYNVVTASSIAHYGRFAHTIWNYLSCRIYADRAGHDLETPEWQGHYYFDLDDPPMKCSREVVRPEIIDDAFSAWTRNRAAGAVATPGGIDLYSPFGDVFRREYRDEILGLTKVRTIWQELFAPALARLRPAGGTLVALHIRAGDMAQSEEVWGRLVYELYSEWMRELWPGLADPVLYVATDDVVAAKRAFAAFSPHCWPDLEGIAGVVSHLFDFHLLSQADIVAISRGNFGKIAAALNRRAVGFYRPDAGYRGLEPFDPWQGGNCPRPPPGIGTASAPMTAEPEARST